MSELSDAEKRRILRERRQNKFKNGGASSRLTQITGQNLDSQLSTKSPLDNLEKVETNADKNTKEMDDLLANVSKAAEENRKTHVKEKKPVEKQKAVNPELELYKQLAEVTQGDGSSTPDIFSMFQSMQQNLGETSNSPASALSPVDQANLDYHNYKLNNFKVTFIFVKWVLFLLPYIYFVTRSRSQNIELQNILSTFTNPRNFFMVFLSFEIVGLSIYLQNLKNLQSAHNIDPIQNAGKFASLIGLIPEGIIPIKDLRGKAILALQYWDLISLFLTDFAFVIVMIGLIKYF